MITIIQLILSIALSVVILLQQKGSGLGAAFGGGGNVYGSTKRGVDLVLYKTTIVLSILFFGVSLLRVVL